VSRLGDFLIARRPDRLNEQETPCPVCGARPLAFHDDAIHDDAWLLRSGEAIAVAARAMLGSSGLAGRDEDDHGP
jgi:hypothetical protein